MISFRDARRGMRRVVERIIFVLAARAWTLRLLNALYLRLGPSTQVGLHSRFAKIYREGQHRLARSTWTIPFAGHAIAIPMRPDQAWLDWDAALSLLGHERAIKDTYSTLISSSRSPDLFVDVGANYGTHSLLFLKAGVETLTFEPNSTCHPYFREICAFNGVTPRLEHAALGSEDGQLELYFPERETWLGSLNPEVIQQLKSLPAVRSERVKVRRLDDYATLFEGRRALIKIDAEDYEYAVLSGASETLRRHRPLVVFEAHRGNGRRALFDLFGSLKYAIAYLPIVEGAPIRVADRDAFLVHPNDDFLAVPQERFTASGTADPDQLFASSP